MASFIKNKTARPNDFMYDPLFTISGPKDHYKAAMLAKISTAKFQICPVFISMFSDLPHQPRTQLVMRKSSLKAPSYEDVSQVDKNALTSNKVDVIGTDRHKFFAAPVHKPCYALPLSEPRITYPQVSSRMEIEVKKHNRKLQTQYRESSAQTSPWEPPYVVMDDSDPEILKLDFLKWGSGLPAGMHEVTLIQRARMKRAWEKVLPPITDAASLEKRRQIIAAMETDEWAFREQEIQDIHDLRLELLEQMLNELHEKSKCRTEAKMKMFCELKEAEKNEKIAKLRHNAQRELRKLEMKHRGINKKYHVVNIIDEHIDRKSELYGPQMRHGEHPKRWHQILDRRLKKYRAQFIGVEAFSTLPRWLDHATKMKDTCTKLPGTRLCIRETKWTTPVLKQLHEELKNLRKLTKRKCKLRTRVKRVVADIETPEVEGIIDSEEDIYQAAVFIQSILRGRASQILIYEGRDRCRELIQELKSTHALLEKERIRVYEERVEVKYQQRDERVCIKNTRRLQEALNRLQGTVIGSLLDFLNKELRRLLDERRAHAMCLLAERERQNREAAEAGRRQAELRRRTEHDEMFKQIVKVHQDTIDLYLQDIITEGMEFASSDDAYEYVVKLAEKIDNDAYKSLVKEQTFKEEEEMVANLVHNFVVPEVEKQIVRDRVKFMQKKYLKTAHEEVYGRIETLPKPPPLLPKIRKKQSIKQKSLDMSEGKATTTSLSTDLESPTAADYFVPNMNVIPISNLSIDDVTTKPNSLNVIFRTDSSGTPDAESYVLSVMGALAGRGSEESKQVSLQYRDSTVSQESSYIPLKRKSPDFELPVIHETPTGSASLNIESETIDLIDFPADDDNTEETQIKEKSHGHVTIVD